jgi:hypothetical protein
MRLCRTRICRDIFYRKGGVANSWFFVFARSRLAEDSYTRRLFSEAPILQNALAKAFNLALFCSIAIGLFL